MEPDQTTPIATEAELFSTPSKRRFKTIGPLPVRGVHVRIRSLMESEVSAYQNGILNRKGEYRETRLREATRRLIALCLVDAQGNPICTDAHMAKMASWDSADTQFLYNECAAHCGINTRDIEDLAKNSEPTPAESSPST